MRRLSNIKRHGGLLATILLISAASWSVGPAGGQSAARTVRLVIDYGDGATKTLSDLPWSKGNTVYDVMKQAMAQPHGITFTFTGSGATAVMTKIDDVQNEGGGAAKKNWQYWVNAIYGDRSFAVFELQAGDVTVWRFAAQQEKPRQ